MHHGCRGSAARGRPPLPSSPASWRSKISAVGVEGGDLHPTLALQYFPSIFTVNTVPFPNNSKSVFDDGLRLVHCSCHKSTAEHGKHRSPSNLTVTPESRKAQIKPGKIPSHSGFAKLHAIPLQQTAPAPPHTVLQRLPGTGSPRGSQHPFLSSPGSEAAER